MRMESCYIAAKLERLGAVGEERGRKRVVRSDEIATMIRILC